ncbi:MAG: hypothetical protein ACXVC6_07540 [Bacteroidia bacterium]
MRSVLILFVSIIILASCAPSRLVRPLDKGQKSVSANLGGPLIGFKNTVIPVPMTSVLYAQGVTNKTSAFGSVHATAMLFGIFQTDIGVCQGLYYNDSLRLGISATPALNMAFDKWEHHFKCWPQLDLNFYWELKPKKSFLYGGVNNWFELAKYKAYGEIQQNHWLVSPQVGFTYCRKKWNYSFEVKYLVPYIENTPNVVDYKGINGKGAIGIYLNFSRKF